MSSNTFEVGQRVKTTVDLDAAEWDPKQPAIPAGSLGTVDGVRHSQADPQQVAGYSVRLDDSVHPLSSAMEPGDVEAAEEDVPIADLEELTVRVTALGQHSTAHGFQPFTAPGDVRPTGWTFRVNHGAAARYTFVTRRGRPEFGTARSEYRWQAENALTALYRAGDLVPLGEAGAAAFKALRQGAPEAVVSVLTQLRGMNAGEEATD
ncbi:hypothetical protein ABT095_15190 [Kitasatospora sp. NPDC002227]|uniref:hypothetical protein n=1 Tax=Kitasatospora sp. NPDC002227 TaxID=3154773 RepID=UPI00332D9709